jgi:regulator of RNase E activity RraA
LAQRELRELIVDMHQLPASVLDLLRKFDTPTICNVIEVFKVRPQTAGYMDRRIRACFPEMRPMVGYASTMTFRSAAAPAKGNLYGTLDAQVARFAELPQPVVVVFQDLDSPPVAATFGEVMTQTYKAFGAVGLITSGAGRDLDQVRAIGFPCFCDGVICSHGYPCLLDVHVPVHVGGVTLVPGELLHGDCNGVTTIPHDIASDVAHACEEFAAAEQVVIDYAKSGNVTPKGLGEARAEMSARVRKLAERVRSTASTT